MSLTDSKRVTTAYYEINKPFIESLEISINGEKNIIPLSQGLNVMIGDNSIGKSLILENLMDPTFSGVKSASKKSGYKNYLKTQKIKVKPFDNNAIKKIHYDYQGKIRELFQSGTKLLDISFFKNKFGVLDNQENEKIVLDYAEKVIKKVNENQITEDINSELDFDIAIPAEIEDKTYLLRITDNLQIKKYNYKIISSSINNVIKSLEDLYKLDGFNDVKIINVIIEKLRKLVDKYNKKDVEQMQNQTIISKIKSICKKYEENNKETSQSQENLLVEYKQNIITAKNKILNKINDYNKEKICVLEKFDTLTLNKIINPEGKYNFITQNICEKITKAEIINILTNPFSNLHSLEKVEKFNKNDFQTKLKKSLKNGNDDFEKIYKDAVKDYLNKKILKQETVITLDNKKIQNGNSQGKNALIYLDVLADEKTNKLYIVDQPDDDISHLKLNSDVINIMRRMGDSKQVLFITHKPELVVNLDVDNVIILKQDDNDKIVINSGALEYENSDKKINILKDVAEILDGGEEIIRKRWKRYDK